jgi:hypothetical protein
MDLPPTFLLSSFVNFCDDTSYTIAFFCSQLLVLLLIGFGGSPIAEVFESFLLAVFDAEPMRSHVCARKILEKR